MGKLRKSDHTILPGCIWSTDGSDDTEICTKKATLNDSTDDLFENSNFDKALIDFYMKQKLKKLKRKLASARMNNDYDEHVPKAKRFKPVKTHATITTRYSGTYFASVLDKLTDHQRTVIRKFGMDCLLKFVKTDVPLRFVKWIAGKFDICASEIQLSKKFIPVTKQTIHNILDLPIDGIELVPDCEAGRSFLLSHFNLTSVPTVNFFANKLSSGEALSDEDIYICFMAVVFTCFLCPNSSLQPSTQYFHIFRDCVNVFRYDLSKFVYNWLLNSIASFQDATKMSSKRSITFGGCHYTLAVSYLDSVEFGLNSLPNLFPRMLVWTGNKIRMYSDLDKITSSCYGKRPLKRLESSSPFQVEQSFGKDSCSKFAKTFQSPFSFNRKLSSLLPKNLNQEALIQITHIVQDNSIGKPQEFVGWAEKLVCDVLTFLQHSNQDKAHSATLKLSNSDNCVLSNNSIGDNMFDFNFPCAKDGGKPTSKEIPLSEPPVIKDPTRIVPPKDKNCCTPTHCNIDHTYSMNIDSGTISKGKLASGKYQKLANLIDNKNKAQEPSPIDDQVRLEGTKSSVPTNSNKTIEPVVTATRHAVSKVKIQGQTNKMNSKVIMIPDSPRNNEGNGCVVNENGPHKEEANPPPYQACKDDVNESKAAFNELSPIIPIRLSQLFNEQVPSMSPSVNSAKVQKVATEIAKKLIDLSTPVCKPQLVLLDDSVSPEVQITGDYNFKLKNDSLAAQTNEAYNRLKNFVSNPSEETNEKTMLMPRHSTNQGSTTYLMPSTSSYVPPMQIGSDLPTGSSRCSTQPFMPRRYIQPNKKYSDPFVTYGNQHVRFPVLPSQRQYYFAICHLGSNDETKGIEAVRYDRTYCSFDSLATLQPRGHIDNYLVLCFCRKMFNEKHPSSSKKHHFFPYIGEAILRYNGTNGDFVQTAFDGATKALPLWKSNELQFPIVIDKHWFLFVVCLKAKAFAFLDSLFNEEDEFQQSMRGPLRTNFIHLWDILVAPKMYKATGTSIDFGEFQTVYPLVPKQDNTDDCGVFLMRFMEIHGARAQLQNAFSVNDVENLRIKYANDIFFDKYNSVDKSMVTEFFR